MSDFGFKFNTLTTTLTSSVAKVVNEINNLDINPCKKNQNQNPTTKKRIRISAVKFDSQRYKRVSDFVEHINEYMLIARDDNVGLISFPQLCTLPSLSLAMGGNTVFNNITNINFPHLGEYFVSYMATMGQWEYELYINTFSTFAKRYNIPIHAGSVFVKENDKYYNRSFVFNNSGEVIGYQDKLFLTNYEKALGLSCGDCINIIHLPNANVAILNDLDCTYYENAKIANQLGASIILSSHLTNDLNSMKKYQESLLWRIEEQNMFAIQSCYKLSYFDTSCGFYSSASLTPDLSGVLLSSNECGVQTYSFNFAKLENKFDPFVCDENTYLYNTTANLIYNDNN